MKKINFALLIGFSCFVSFSSFSMDSSSENILNVICREEEFLTKIGLLSNLEIYFEKNPDKINTKNFEGETLIHILIRLYPEIKIKKSLIKAHSLGADFNMPNNDGLTPVALLLKLNQEKFSDQASRHSLAGNIEFFNNVHRKWQKYGREKYEKKVGKLLVLLGALGADIL